MEESDGERTAGSDTAETEERAIRAMPIVTTLSYVRADKDKVRGVRVTLTCYNCREYDNCEKPREAPIQLCVFYCHLKTYCGSSSETIQSPE